MCNNDMEANQQNHTGEICFLYQRDFLSASEIAEKLSLSIDAVYYCLRKNKIPRRTTTEQNIMRFEKTPSTFLLMSI